MKPVSGLENFGWQMSQSQTGVGATIGDHGAITVGLHQDDNHASARLLKSGAMSADPSAGKGLQVRSAKGVVAYAPYKVHP
jgi:hypothetical protein